MITRSPGKEVWRENINFFLGVSTTKKIWLTSLRVLQIARLLATRGLLHRVTERHAAVLALHLLIDALDGLCPLTTTTLATTLGLAVLAASLAVLTSICHAFY